MEGPGGLVCPSQGTAEAVMQLSRPAQLSGRILTTCSKIAFAIRSNFRLRTAVRTAKLQHEAAGQISGLLAMMQPDTPSPRKHSRKGKNPKSSYSMFARPASMVEADAQGQFIFIGLL